MKKEFWKSKTTQGIMIVILTIAIKFAAAKGWLGAEFAKMTQEYLSDLMDALGIGGAAYGFYGRLVTKGEKLSLSKETPKT